MSRKEECDCGHVPCRCADDKRADELERFASLFSGGWDHFLKCIDFKHTFLDAEAISWMNEVGMAEARLIKK